MYRVMTADEAISLIRDGDCICVNSFVGIENPVELHEALGRRYEKTHSPKHLTVVSSAGFGVWEENRAAEGYIRDGAVDRLICGHFGSMPGTKKIILENRFEAYNLPLGCISHAIRAQAGGIPDALSICQAAKSNNGIVIVQVDRIVDMPSRPRSAIIPGCLVDAIVVQEPEPRDEAFTALTGSFEIPYAQWHVWTEKLEAVTSAIRERNVASHIIGRRAARELHKEDIINIGIPEMISPYARQSGMLDHITLTVESGGIGGFANITGKTPTVVFCLTFNTKGLSVYREGERVTVERNGAVPKFVRSVRSVSFTARSAIKNGQKVLYITERCVFILTARGLKLLEVYPGVDMQRDILDLLPFDVELPEGSPL